jgi:DNA polymerase III subunit alpha
VMLISQVMADFTRGQADMLRKAMGKKDMALLAQQKQKFVDGAIAKGVDAKIANELFDKMAKFGGYGFNRAHAAAYSVLAYQTGYLKANFLPEYMASVLTNSMGDIDKLTFFIDECRKMGLPVLGPDLNKSEHIFSVTPKGEISFGLGAVKGVGEAAVAAIVAERETNGLFKDVYDMMSRVNLRSANKKTFESLIMAGAFDSLGTAHRAQYFHQENGKISFLESLIRFGNAVQDASTQGQNSLFGETIDSSVSKPTPVVSAPWSRIELINKEKEVAGFYISGHPLDDFKFDIENFCTMKLNGLEDLTPLKGKEISIAGIVTEAAHRLTQGGKPFGSFSLEDYHGKVSMMLWQDDYVKWKHYLENGMFLFVKAKVNTRYNSENLELKVTQIYLLSSIRDKYSKSLTLQIPLKEVSADMARYISDITAATPGMCSLKILVVDSEENMSVDLISKKIRFNLTNDLIQQVQKISGISMKLN